MNPTLNLISAFCYVGIGITLLFFALNQLNWLKSEKLETQKKHLEPDLEIEKRIPKKIPDKIEFLQENGLRLFNQGLRQNDFLFKLWKESKKLEIQEIDNKILYDFKEYDSIQKIFIELKEFNVSEIDLDAMFYCETSLETNKYFREKEDFNINYYNHIDSEEKRVKVIFIQGQFNITISLTRYRELLLKTDFYYSTIN